MAKRNNDLKITVAHEDYLVKDLMKIVMNIQSQDANNLFMELNITFGRELRISVLRKVFKDPVILTRRERNSLADEMNYRLSWFNQYSETQLINLFKFYKNPELEQLYLETLWETIIEELEDKKISKESFKRLLDLSNKKYQKEDIIAYNKNLDDIFFDEKGKLDGLTPEQLRPVLYKSSTIVEIREIGKKYGVNVPSRLRKAELLAIIINELKDDNKYSEELEENLNKLNILLLQRFAKDNNIKASTELKKEEVIEYVLSNATQTKEAYYVPKEEEYHLEADHFGEVLEEEIVEEIIEEVIEEAVEEIVEEAIEEEIIEEALEEEEVLEEEPVVEEVVHVREVVQATNEFDPSTVEGTVLNTVTFGELKPKQFVEIASLEKVFNEVKEPAEQKANIQTIELVTPKKRKSVLKTILKIILIIIVVLINIAIILSLYALFTPNGVPALKGTEEFIEKILRFNFFEIIRDFVRGLIN